MTNGDDNPKKRTSRFTSQSTGLTKDFSESNYWQDLILNNPDTYGKPFIEQQTGTSNEVAKLLQDINKLETEIEELKKELKKEKKGHGDLQVEYLKVNQDNVKNLQLQNAILSVISDTLKLLSDDKGLTEAVPRVERVRRLVRDLLEKLKDLEKTNKDLSQDLTKERERPLVVGGSGGLELTDQERYLFGYADRTYGLISRAYSEISGGFFDENEIKKYAEESKLLVRAMQGEVADKKGLGSIGVYIQKDEHGMNFIVNEGKVRDQLMPLYYNICLSLYLIVEIGKKFNELTLLNKTVEQIYDRLGVNSVNEVQNLIGSFSVKEMVEENKELKLRSEENKNLLEEILKTLNPARVNEHVQKIEFFSFNVFNQFIKTDAEQQLITLAKNCLNVLRPIYLEYKLFWTWKIVKELAFDIIEIREKEFPREEEELKNQEIVKQWKTEEKEERKKLEEENKKQHDELLAKNAEDIGIKKLAIRSQINGIINKYKNTVAIFPDFFDLEQDLNKYGTDNFLWIKAERWDGSINNCADLRSLKDKEDEIKSVLAELVIRYFMRRETPTLHIRPDTVSELVKKTNLQIIEDYMVSHNSPAEQVVYDSLKEEIKEYKKKIKTIENCIEEIVVILDSSKNAASAKGEEASKKLKELVKIINDEHEENPRSTKYKLTTLKDYTFSYLGFLLQEGKIGDKFLKWLNEWEKSEGVTLTLREVRHTVREWFDPKIWPKDKIFFSQKIFDIITKDETFDKNQLLTESEMVKKVEMITANIEFSGREWDKFWTELEKELKNYLKTGLVTFFDSWESFWRRRRYELTASYSDKEASEKVERAEFLREKIRNKKVPWIDYGIDEKRRREVIESLNSLISVLTGEMIESWMLEKSVSPHNLSYIFNEFIIFREDDF
jgi:hypothetical protein